MKNNSPAVVIVLITIIFIEGVLILLALYPRNRKISLTDLDYKTNFISSNPKKADFTPQPISLDSIFSTDHDWTATLSAERITTVIATGDILTARSVNAKTVEKNNFHWAFEKTADLLRSGDITIINLETPLVEDCPTTNTGMIFCGDTRNVDGLLFAGIDVVNIANNHMGNWGQEGVDMTVRVLQDAELLPAGVTNSVYKEVNGMKFSFLGYNDIGRQVGVSHVDDEKYEEEIRLAKSQSDVVIVSFHWGVEYTHQPTSRQIEIARRAIDAGADLVIGSHPHVIQPIEIYKNKLIAYSLGNLVFDQASSGEKTEAILLKVQYEDKDINTSIIPIKIQKYFQPTPVSPASSGNYLKRLNQANWEFSLPR